MNDLMQNNIIWQWAQNHPILFLLITVWTILLKGIALWKAAKNDSQKWFIALLILNTLGILELLYLYVFSKKKALLPNINK